VDTSSTDVSNAVGSWTMPTTTVTRPRGDWRSRLRWGPWATWIALAVAVVAAIAVSLLVLDDPDRYDIEVSNPTVYEISVSVSDGSGEGEMALLTLEPGETRSASGVRDQGESWVFIFRAHGLDGGELRAVRSDLRQAGWQITVPDDVARQLEALGAQPAP
jgi:hypothetical protein